jgi:hypothetical protein
MCWKDMMKNFWSKKYLFCATTIILILAGLITWFDVSLLEKFFIDYSNYKTAIITTSALAIGVLVYIGNCAAMEMKYRLIEVRFAFKEYTITVGSIFLVVIAAIYFLHTQDYLLNVLYYMVEMGALAFFLGLTIYINPDKNKNVTLKMITCDEAGCKRLETRNDLVLYQITGTDYRFKDFKNKKELIIPIGQIQEIEEKD